MAFSEAMRTAVAAFTLIVLALGAAPARAADPRFEASLGPDRIAFGEADPEARLTIETGAEAETFEVGVGASSGEFTDLDGRNAGFSLFAIGCAEPRLEGPGTLGRSACAVPALASCNRTFLKAFHGAPDGSSSHEVSVGPRTRTTFVVRGSQARDAPWPASRYQARFFLRGGTLDGDRVIDTPRIAPAGRTGVRIALRVEPAGGGLCQPAPEIRGPVTVRGRTDPSLAGQEIVLRTATEEDREPRDLARVRVADDGTFTFAGWRPEPGYREVAAQYTSQRPELADDFSAPTSFVLRANDPEPPPEGEPDRGQDPDGGSRGPVVEPAQAAPQLLDRTLRVDRAGRVRLRLYCPRMRDACRGQIRVRIGGRSAAFRGLVTVAAGARRTVRVRLGRAARRRIAGRRGVRATVRIGDRPVVAVMLRPRK